MHATLLDEDQYIGSVRALYRLLASNGGCRERRNQLTHPAYTKPELLAVAPNQVGHGIRAKGKRRFKVTTGSNHDLPIAPNLLNREFTVDQPDKAWAGDITYIATDEG